MAERPGPAGRGRRAVRDRGGVSRLDRAVIANIAHLLAAERVLGLVRIAPGQRVDLVAPDRLAVHVEGEMDVAFTRIVDVGAQELLAPADIHVIVVRRRVFADARIVVKGRIARFASGVVEEVMAQKRVALSL